MKNYLIKNAQIVNRGNIEAKDIFIKNGRFVKIENHISTLEKVEEIDASGQYVFPGIIDDQVHFRQPGLTHKADIYSESRAAVAGGVTSFMEMPNTNPATLTQQLLEEKYQIAAKNSPANYSFFMGASNDNLDEVLKTDAKNVCGIKVFMGSSTGNMLVDNPDTLEKLFSSTPMLVATHCEDEEIIKNNTEKWKNLYGSDIAFEEHCNIRSVEACLKSSTLAVNLAKKYGTRLHVLHISTKNELSLFDNKIPLIEKKITAEVCVHHLFFNSNDYEKLGSLIKCNPAIKSVEHQKSLLPALLDNTLDIIATDHAPHTWEEKKNSYFGAPSGLPLVQHSLSVMLDFYHRGQISLEKIVEKMCHAPAECFKIQGRGFIEEGYFADLIFVDIDQQWNVTKSNILYKCAWSPFENQAFRGKVTRTFVNGNIVFENDTVVEGSTGSRLLFH